MTATEMSNAISVNNADLPFDIRLALPKSTALSPDQQHFLIYIPWRESYLELVPAEYREFFIAILPYLHARTTDVHTAVSMSFLKDFVTQFSDPINERAVALALMLHDAGWSKLSELEIANSLGVTGLKLTENAIAPKEKHAIESEKIARKVLTDTLFAPPLSNEEIELICQAVRFHDQPEAVAGADEPMPLEVQILVDLDHIWSFTHENFWQDTVRKGVYAADYVVNLENDLDSYFVTTQGKALARKLLAERKSEVDELAQLR